MQDKLSEFYIEWKQGVDPKWLLNKYNLSSLLDVTEKGDIYSTSPEGIRIIHRLKDLDAKSIAKARIDQRENSDDYPWSNPPSKIKK